MAPGDDLPSTDVDGVLGGVASILGVIAVASALIGAVLYRRDLVRWYRRLADRVSPPPETAAGRPIERIARDVRRLHAEVLALAPGTPMARRRGLVQAYDDLLSEACRALGVPETLTDLPLQTRDGERIRVEQALDRAGLRLEA